MTARGDHANMVFGNGLAVARSQREVVRSCHIRRKPWRCGFTQHEIRIGEPAAPWHGGQRPSERQRRVLRVEASARIEVDLRSDSRTAIASCSGVGCGVAVDCQQSNSCRETAYAIFIDD